MPENRTVTDLSDPLKAYLAQLRSSPDLKAVLDHYRQPRIRPYRLTTSLSVREQLEGYVFASGEERGIDMVIEYLTIPGKEAPK